MSIYIIAQVVNASDIDKVIGYKLLDCNATKKENATMSVKTEALINAVKNNRISLKNAEVINNELIGTNGRLDRYAKIDINNKIIGLSKSPLVIISKIADVGYKVADCFGNIEEWKTERTVEYAKNYSIANGKIVIKDSIEFISSIQGEYDTIELVRHRQANKIKASDIKIADYGKGVVSKSVGDEISSEVDYNDTFKAFTDEQRLVLRSYYIWYTVDIYLKLAKTAKLELSPKKAEKLANIRGDSEWEFAGINFTTLENPPRIGKCELGHRLYREFLAMPVDSKEAGMTTYNRIKYVCLKGDNVQTFKDAGAIVFGEGCAGDFFNISPEDMKKLTKTREIMCNELEEMADVITNHKEPLKNKQCKLLLDIIQKLGSADKVTDMFGEKVGETLLAFMKAKLPFNQSLVLLAAEQIRANSKKFFVTMFPEYTYIINELLNVRGAYESESSAFGAGYALLEAILNYSIECGYMYDPVNDELKLRKDVGRYNKDTRAQQEAYRRGISNGTSVNYHYITSLYDIEKYLKVFSFYNEAYMTVLRLKDTENYKGIFSNCGELSRVISRYIKNYEGTISKELLDELSVLSNLSAFDKESGSFSPLVESRIVEKRTNKTFVRFSYNYDVTFKTYMASIYNNALLKNCLNIDDLYRMVNKLTEEHGTADVMVKSVLDALVNSEKEKLEQEMYVQVNLWSLTDTGSRLINENGLFGNVAKLKYKVINQIKDGSMDKAEVIDINIDDKVLVSDIKDLVIIKDYEYESIIETQKDKMEARRIEEEAQLRLAEKTKAEMEEKARLKEEEEQRGNDKINHLKKLIEGLDKNSDELKSYGVNTAIAIIKSGKSYNKLSPRQRWRIDETTKELESLNNNLADKYKNLSLDDEDNQTDNNEKQAGSKLDTLENAEDTSKSTDDTAKKEVETETDKYSTIDVFDKVEYILNKVNTLTEKDSEVTFAYKVSKTVSKSKQCSDKQKLWISKGFSKLKDRDKEGEEGQNEE